MDESTATAIVVKVAPERPVTVTAEPIDMTIGGLLLRWLAAMKGDRTPAQLRGCSRWWRARQVANALGSRTAVPVSLLGPRMLREIQGELAAVPMTAKRGGETVHRTRGVVNRTIREIVSMLKWAVAEELVPVERYQALRCVTGLRAGDQTPARESTPRKGAPDADVAAIGPFLPPVLADVIRVARLSSCRPDEVLGLRMADVVEVPELGVWRYTPGHHKTAHHGHTRAIAIGPEAHEIIRRWASGKPATALVFSKADLVRARTSTTIRVYPERIVGERLKPDYLYHAVLRACDAAKVARWTPYQLRHAGLQETRDKFGPEHAQAVGGQANLKVAEIYAKASFEKAAEVARAIG